MTDRIGMIYVESDIELSWLIGLGVHYDENQMGQYVIDHTNVVYAKNEIELLWSVGPGPIFDEN